MIHPLTTACLKSANILLVDDQPAVRSGLKMLFQLETADLKIDEAGTGFEALSAARLNPPDLVIMDVEMPGIDGFAATEQLIDALPTCLVIMLTIHDTPQLRSRALAAGAWAYIRKGRPEEVRDAFRQALGFIGAASD